ncbi:MAG: RNA 2',3'-cyclic phosphodiesterase [Herminiimonas sp.]|nr:RNA 2',3'-cyclic phosphodiesterase [Herminiimonas sp.]
MITDKRDYLRLFYALWPDGATRAALSQLQIAMAGRLTRSDNLHLTLAFLGAQPPSSLPLLESILMALPSVTPKLTFDRIGYFTEPQLAWAGMSAVPEALSTLEQNLAQALERAGIHVDRRSSFIPHVTLARNTTALEDFPFDAVEWKASHVALVHSDVEGGEVVYRVLTSRMLDGR